MLYINFDIFNLHLKNTYKSVNIIIKIDPILFFFFFYVFVVTNNYWKTRTTLMLVLRNIKKKTLDKAFGDTAF